MAALRLVDLDAQVEADVCPICGAAGLAPCEEEDGQFVLDHFGRTVSAFVPAAAAVESVGAA